MPKSSALEISSRIPTAFIWRRLHSLTGLWLVLYLSEHLLVNSQAALLFEDQDNQFVRMVKLIHDLPYLQAVEIIFLGIPFFIHMFWGVQYVMTGKINSFPTDGRKPSLTQYRRNHAYSWQRITSWVLLIGIIAHVVHMRFYEYPFVANVNNQKQYFVPLEDTEANSKLAKRLNIEFVPASTVENQEWQKYQKQLPQSKQQVAITSKAGDAFLLIVRDTFQNPYMVILYSLLVIAAVFHAFNGVWTFLITWGVTLTRRSQYAAEYITWGLMAIVAFLGLMATIGTFFVKI